MKESRILYFVLGSLVVLTMAQAPLAVHSDGIEFPDGTIQTTAAVDLAAAARQSVNSLCIGSVDPGTNWGYCSPYAVPTGKIFVLESISGALGVPPGQQGQAYLYRQPVGGGALIKIHYLPLLLIDGTTNNFQLRNNMLRAYFGEEQQVIFRVYRDDTVAELGFEVTVSGYLVDASP